MEERNKVKERRKGEAKNSGKTLTIVLRRNSSGVPNPIQSPGRYYVVDR